MTKKVTLLDYGLGNILSVIRACEFNGYEVKIIDNGNSIDFSSPVILPGVGAFPEAMSRINTTGLHDAIHEIVLREIPLLGICLGMQLLFESSEEQIKTDGLNLLKGDVIKLKSSKFISGLRLPSVGWRDVRFNGNTHYQNNSQEITKSSSFYFVHSYHAIVKNTEDVVATYERGDEDIVAIVNRNNIWGAQFHPEKSGRQGLKLLNTFLET